MSERSTRPSDRTPAGQTNPKSGYQSGPQSGRASDTSPASAPKDAPPAQTDSRRAGVTTTNPPTGAARPEAKGSVVDRRSGIDRRDLEVLRAKHGPASQTAAKTGAGEESPTTTGPTTTGLERRRGPGRRLSDFTRAAEEGELTQEQFLFIMAIEEFKRANDKQFPSWSDVLEVIRLLGYRKTMTSELNLRSAEDWRESPISPSNVRAPRWAEHMLVDAARARLRDETQQADETTLRHAA